MPHEKPAFGQILLVILPEVPLTGPSLSNALLHRPYGGQIPRADKYRTVNIMLQQMLREVTPAACLPDNHLHQTVQRAGVIPGQANAEIRFQFQQACKSRTYEIRQVILSEADKHIATVTLNREQMRSVGRYQKQVALPVPAMLLPAAEDTGLEIPAAAEDIDHLVKGVLVPSYRKIIVLPQKDLERAVQVLFPHG